MESVIHPLVFLNISNHFTHARVNKQIEPNKLLCGCLLGTRIGRRTELFTSFELKLDHDIVDRTLLLERAAQFYESYTDYTVLGWYFIGSQITPQVLTIHKQVAAITECSLVCVMFDEQQTTADKQFVLFEIEVCFFRIHFLCYSACRMINSIKFCIILKLLNQKE